VRWPVISNDLAYGVLLRLGIHLFTFGSLEKVALRAAEIGAETFQIFSSSPRMWRAGTPDALQVRRLRETCQRHAIYPLVIHVSYLINLASGDPEIHAKSITAFRGELERASAIGAQYLVLHPGSYRGRSCEQGIVTFVDGLRQAAAGFHSPNLTVLLENTTGAGCHIGSRFEELRDIRSLARDVTNLPIGYCLDTCHLFTAGFDITSPEGLRATLRSADGVLDMANVHLIHANDSKAPAGSHIDRHARIGEGYLGLEPFRRLLAHPKIRNKAVISETPAEAENDDLRNLQTLKSLAPNAIRKRLKS
jgi:deoxyribonuclease-4